MGSTSRSSALGVCCTRNEDFAFNSPFDTYPLFDTNQLEVGQASRDRVEQDRLAVVETLRDLLADEPEVRGPERSPVKKKQRKQSRAKARAKVSQLLCQGCRRFQSNSARDALGEFQSQNPEYTESRMTIQRWIDAFRKQGCDSLAKLDELAADEEMRYVKFSKYKGQEDGDVEKEE